MKADKENGGICFNEEHHVYWDKNDKTKKFISVTTLIERFGQDYDAEFWSHYKGLQALVKKEKWRDISRRLLEEKKMSSFSDDLLSSCGITRDHLEDASLKVKREWKKTNDDSCTRGTNIHSGFEHGTYAHKDDVDLKEYGIDGKFVCDIGRKNIDLPDSVYPEFLLSWSSPDNKLNIAGQSDLMVLKGHDDLFVIDYKGLPLDTPILTDKGFTTMGKISPGDHIFDMHGKVQTVMHKSRIHHNECCTIFFDNGDSITCDIDHRWRIDDGHGSIQVMTAGEMKECKLEMYIDNPDPVDYGDGDKSLKEDPYLFGMCGDGEVPDEYIAASYKQREALLCGYFDNLGHVDGEDKVLHIEKSHKGIIRLLGTLGIKYTEEENDIRYNDTGYDITYTARKIIDIIYTKSVPTACIEVSGPTHTYLCTDSCIVTHNTNKEIKLKSFYDREKKSTERMKFPLDDLDDCNYNHYQMQLSTYAWMAQQKWKNLKVDGLMLRHIDHSGKQKIYHCEYLKNQVEDMINYFYMKKKTEEQEKKYKKIIY